MQDSDAKTEHSRANGLRREELAACPFEQFGIWFREALAEKVPHAGVMILATVGADNKPDQRAVLLKHADARGLVFFSDDASKKISDIHSHPCVSAYFPWYGIDRQLRLSGRVERIRAAEATRYFVTPPEYQAAEASPWDSSPGMAISSREFLMQQYRAMQSRFYGGGGREAGHWSGYRIVPDAFEFWQGGGPRLRDRFTYVRGDAGAWSIETVTS